ncbi:MAG: fimbrillin family protein, partial [Bacteroidales bacterium]
MKKFMVLAACAATFYACSSNDVNTPEINENTTGLLSVSTSVLTQNTKSTKTVGGLDAAHTGPVMGTGLASGAKIGVFVFNNNDKFEGYTGATNSGTNPALNQLWTNGANGWGWPQFTLGIQPAKVFAYFPYDQNKTTYNAIPVEAGYTDYLYGKSPNVNSTNTGAKIQLNHALSLISFTFRKTTSYPTGEDAALQSITIKSLPANGTMNISATSDIVSVIAGTKDLAIEQWSEAKYVAFDRTIPEKTDLTEALGYAAANTTPLYHTLVLPQTNLPSDKTTLHASIVIDSV